MGPQRPEEVCSWKIGTRRKLISFQSLYDLVLLGGTGRLERFS
jgi:hypothetical protein